MEIISNKVLLCCWREMDQFNTLAVEKKTKVHWMNLCHPNFSNNNSPSHKGLFP